MTKINLYPRAKLTIVFIVLCVFLLSTCAESDEKIQTHQARTPNGFAGSVSCITCHKKVSESHAQTAHFKTSSPASEESILGSFEEDKNKYYYNGSVYVTMESRDSGFYQVEYFREEEKKARRFDIAIGSGTKGQSFLYWKNNNVFQLPITYFTRAHQWSNSPGFPDKVVFNRVITSRCLECHTTFTKTMSAPGKEPEEFERNNMIFGVDCEKCHGPSAKHVQFQTKNPSDSIGKFVINPAKLSRQQNLDLCALCHGGRLEKTTPSFSFTAGQKLSDHFNIDSTAPNPQTIDVHGNQYGLLSASECFRKSKTMTCNSCHNPHQNEKGNKVLFSQRCMNCHNPKQPNFCPMQKTLGPSIQSNCIDCHMAIKPSKAIAVFLAGNTTPTSALIRSHFISINLKETANKEVPKEK